LAERVAFTIVVEPAAKVDLDALRAFDRRRIVDAVDADLLHEPAAGSRKRKRLGELETGFEYEPPLWELKVGEYRVFYNVNEGTRTVRIWSVRFKPPGKTTAEVVR
jgi:mRNA-degrading endonuclease RelE of RelBE toxin-antitoxin system